jgi:hypothetical protein
MPGDERNIVYAQLACIHVVDLFDHPCRHLHGAWQEWRRAGSRANDPHALVAEQLEALGPAKFCPACAGTPDSAGSWPAPAVVWWQLVAAAGGPCCVAAVSCLQYCQPSQLDCFQLFTAKPSTCAGAAASTTTTGIPQHTAAHLFGDTTGGEPCKLLHAVASLQPMSTRV